MIEREHPRERNERLQLPGPVVLRWREALSMSFIAEAICPACKKLGQSWMSLGFPADCEKDEKEALEDLEWMGCPHTEEVRIVLQLLRLERP